MLQDLQRASQLFAEMARCGVERNVHTYTALMNVCIKCQNCPRALETYNTMRQAGCFPNVVTYNTLIECGLDSLFLHALELPLPVMKQALDNLQTLLHDAPF